MARYTIRNSDSLKVVGTSDLLINARKRAYKEVMAHKRSRFSIEKSAKMDWETGIGEAEYTNGKVIWQSYKNGTYQGAYILSKDGSIRRY